MSESLTQDEEALKQQQEETKLSSDYRKALPCEMFDRSKVSIWAFLKQCVGKELHRFTIPIIWNEPLSFLQRAAENVKFADAILNKAATTADPLERMKLVASFLISVSSINIMRISKPFNPLLGETYELISPENTYRICCEQVSHHPPVSAFYAESLVPSAQWRYHGSLNPVLKLNIMNACVEADPEGIQTLEFPELGETYTWLCPKVFAHNLIIGKLWFEFAGQVEIVNHKLNMKCVMEFRPYSWYTRQVSRVDGYIIDSNDNKLTLLAGKWDEYFYATSDATKSAELTRAVDSHPKFRQDKSGGVELLWDLKAQREELTKCLPEYYNFTEFTIKLNDLLEQHIKPCELPVAGGQDKDQKDETNKVTMGPIAPTDCRWRPDLRLYEKGQLETASSEKTRLEEKQRETRRQVEAGEAEAYQPLWFDLKPHHAAKEQETWTFNNKYWDRDFSKSPQIF